MKVLITGSSGFIGHVVADRLRDQHELILPLRKQSPRLSIHQSSFALIPSIDRNSDWRPFLKGVDTVVHLAAMAHQTPRHEADELHMYEANVKGTEKLVGDSIACGVRRFIFLSTIGVNGRCTGGERFSERDAPNPSGSYARSKLEAETVLRQLATQGSMEFVIIRAPLVYGADAPGKFRALSKLVRILPANIFAGIHNRRSLVSVRNLTDFVECCIRDSRAENELFLLADLTISTAELFDLLSLAAGRRTIKVAVPPRVFRALGVAIRRREVFESLIGSLEIDSTKAQRLLNWTPGYDFLETMESSGRSLTHDR